MLNLLNKSIRELHIVLRDVDAEITEQFSECGAFSYQFIPSVGSTITSDNGIVYRIEEEHLCCDAYSNRIMRIKVQRVGCIAETINKKIKNIIGDKHIIISVDGVNYELWIDNDIIKDLAVKKEGEYIQTPFYAQTREFQDNAIASVLSIKNNE